LSYLSLKKSLNIFLALSEIKVGSNDGFDFFNNNNDTESFEGELD
jgi:hypothetical protein